MFWCQVRVSFLSSGIVLEPRRSKRHPKIRLHDLDFADDIALLASTIEKAESLLHSVESASNAVGLHLKFSMKERQTHFFSTLGQTNNIKTKKGFTLENVPHSIVLGLEPRRSRRYPEIRLHDLDFADDIALLALTIEKAESLLHSVESASNAVGLHLKFSMKERQTHFFSTLGQTNNIKTKTGFTLENVPHSIVLCLEPRRSRRHPEIRLHDLDFADDIALLASTIEKAESLLHSVESASNAVGLGLHLKFSMKERQRHFFSTLGQTNNIKTKKGFTLENVPHSKYLGSYICTRLIP